MKNLNTERLTLRACTGSDAAFVLSLLNSPGWLQYIGDRHVHSIEEAKTYIENRMMPAFDKYGYGMCVVCLADETPIGLCGIVIREGLDHPDIGFAFLPAYHGQGYALEACRAILQFVIEETDIDVLLAIATPDNKRSIQLVEKLGMQYDSQYQDSQTQETLVKYTLRVIDII